MCVECYLSLLYDMSDSAVDKSHLIPAGIGGMERTTPKYYSLLSRIRPGRTNMMTYIFFAV